MITTRDDDYERTTTFTDDTRRLRWRASQRQCMDWHRGYQGTLSPYDVVREWLIGDTPRRMTLDGWRLAAGAPWRAP